jgi:DNA-binding NarL/FixJ family response regulator
MGSVFGGGSGGVGKTGVEAQGTRLPQRTRIVVVDDHPLIRAGIRSTLTAAEGVECVGECGDGRSALIAVRNLNPDCVIVDVELPGALDGLELTKCICAEIPHTQILVLSIHDEFIYALRSIAAGARGYLMKDAGPEKLVAAVQAIRRGEIVLSELVSQRLVRRAVGCRDPVGESSLERLSDRELQVLCWMSKGASGRGIAQTLGISMKTIETHRDSLKRKLALESASELTRFALSWRAGLLDRTQT